MHPGGLAIKARNTPKVLVFITERKSVTGSDTWTVKYLLPVIKFTHDEFTITLVLEKPAGARARAPAYSHNGSQF